MSQTLPNNLVLAGSSTLRFLGFRIYEAKLWVQPGFSAASYANHYLELKIDYARSLEGRLIAERSLVEMNHLASIDNETSKHWLAFMQSAFPDVRAGDNLTGRHDGHGLVSFFYNGKPSGVITDPEFARLFFGIWLHPSTSQPGLRKTLLGDFL